MVRFSIVGGTIIRTRSNVVAENNIIRWKMIAS